MRIIDERMELASTKISFFRTSLMGLDLQLDACDEEMNKMVEGCLPYSPKKLDAIAIRMSSICHEISFFKHELKSHLKLLSN
jgi:hypothetical protein